MRLIATDQENNMSVFSFLKGGVTVDDIQAMLSQELGNQIKNLKVEIHDTRADLFGDCDSIAVKEKAILLAGNVKGIEQVNSFHLKAPPSPTSGETTQNTESVTSAEVVTSTPGTDTGIESEFYQIKSGDTLSKIAKAFYGDANQYPLLFEENKEIIKNPDKIYPGQMIRIPKKLSAK
jgi:nucleoid-associated protein YgaU